MNLRKMMTQVSFLLYQSQLQVTTSVCGLQFPSSLFSFFSSEPCQPTGVSSFMNCIANIAVVSWNGSAGAMFYIASVTQGDGQSESCWSDFEQCGVPNIRCGQNYTVTVTASNNQCNSDPSKANTMKSGNLHSVFKSYLQILFYSLFVLIIFLCTTFIHTNMIFK